MALATGNDLQTSGVMMNFSEKPLQLFMTLYSATFPSTFFSLFFFLREEVANDVLGCKFMYLYYSSDWDNIPMPTLTQGKQARECNYMRNILKIGRAHV